MKFNLTVPEMFYVVTLILLILLYFYASYFKQDVFQLPSHLRNWMLFRSVVGFLSDVLLFVGFLYTSYAKAFCLFFTNPLMCPFMAHYICGEKIKLWDIIGILFGLTGMILIIHPWNMAVSDTDL